MTQSGGFANSQISTKDITAQTAFPSFAKVSHAIKKLFAISYKAF
jgi:hypothetical protein